MGKLRTLMAMGVGAAAGYWLDPDNGRARRARVKDQGAARIRDARRAMSREVEYRKGMARGLVHEMADAVGEERRFDDETLQQKVRSEAIGPWRAADESRHDLEVSVTDGTVWLGGAVPDEASRGDLVQRVEAVEGVEAVEDRTQPAGGS